MSGVARLAWGIGGLICAVVASAQLRIMPGQWRMSAQTPAGVLHYKACLQSRHFAAQILSHEGQHCRLVGPVIVRGSVVRVHEDCRVSQFAGQHGVRLQLTAHVRVEAGGRRFAGRSNAVLATPLGNITEHQQIRGAWVAPCPAS